MLTVRDHMMLDLEQHWWKYAGAKHAAILETFGVLPARYYQELNVLIEKPEAAAEYPQVVHRLRRLRDIRRTARRAG